MAGTAELGVQEERGLYGRLESIDAERTALSGGTDAASGPVEAGAGELARLYTARPAAVAAETALAVLEAAVADSGRRTLGGCRRPTFLFSAVPLPVC